MKNYIKPLVKVRALQSEQLLAAMSLVPPGSGDDGRVGDDDPIFAPHKGTNAGLQIPRSVWADDEEE